MLAKRTLGSVVKEARDRARMTQRDLAAAIGVKAAHIAYMENGHRKPSISLVGRLAQVLGVNGKDLLVLAQPEVKHLLAPKLPASKEGAAAWRRLASDTALLKAHAVSPGELKLLKRIARLSPITDTRHFIFVLNAIRRAATEF